MPIAKEQLILLASKSIAAGGADDEGSWLDVESLLQVGGSILVTNGATGPSTAPTVKIQGAYTHGGTPTGSDARDVVTYSDAGTGNDEVSHTLFTVPDSVSHIRSLVEAPVGQAVTVEVLAGAVSRVG